MERKLFESLEAASKKIKKYTENGDFVRITSHLDADGIASAGILSTAFLRLDVPFRIRIERAITEKVIDEIGSEEPPVVIFTDLGSGYMDLIKDGLSKETDVIILDHHRPMDVQVPPNVVHSNPRPFGFNVGYEISGAGMTYLLARTLDKENENLAYLAVIGALGDLQDRDRKLHSINRVIVEKAVNSGFLEVTSDLLFYGRETRPLGKALAYTINPFLPKLSGREDRCVALLQSSGVRLKNGARWRTLRDLSDEEKEKIILSITKFLAPNSADVLDLVGEVYTLTHEEPLTPFRDAREFSSLLNACSRMKRPGLAISLCIGSRMSKIKEAEGALAEYRKKLATHLDWAMNGDNVKTLENAYFIDGRGVIEEDLIGTITSISTSIFSDKVVVGLANAEEEGLVKVSARISRKLVNTELNVSEIVIGAAKSYNGRGGGHEAAAGAYVPREKADEFVRKCDQLLKA